MIKDRAAVVGRVDDFPEVTPIEQRQMVDAFRWAGREIRGGMDAYIRVRAAAQSDAFRRTANELEAIVLRGVGGNDALLALAESLRARSLAQHSPAGVALPTLWPAHRPVPDLDSARVRREQEIGFSLGLTRCAAQIHLAAGGRV